MKVFNAARILEDVPTSLRKEIYIELYADIVQKVCVVVGVGIGVCVCGLVCSDLV